MCQVSSVDPFTKQAYDAHLQANIAWQKEWDNKQRAENQMYENVLKKEQEAQKLSAGLKNHDTNALDRAKSFLWEDDEVGIAAFQSLFWSQWSEADAVIGTYILQGTNVIHQCRMIQEIACDVPPPDRFSNILFQMTSSYSTNNTRLVEAALPALARIQGLPVDTCLANLALKHPDFTIRKSALSILARRNKALYSQTLLQMADDKEFTGFLSEQNVGRSKSR